MKNCRLLKRKLVNALALSLATLAALAALAMLLWILAVVARRGLAAVDRDFFFRLPVPPGMQGGGLANAMAGTVLITVLAAAMAVPPGVATGIYLAEFGAASRFAGCVRLAVNVLMGIPSIIVGLFVWAVMVKTTGGFSAWAGAASLALIMVPVVARTTEDMLGLVPANLREAAVAMGARRYQAMLIILRAARNGLITGVLLALARVSGETAPLLFTALNSPYWPSGLDGPTANLPVTIFNYAMSPYPDWQAKAWGAALVITLAVLALSIGARMIFKENKR